MSAATIPAAPLHLELAIGSPMRIVLEVEHNFLGMVGAVGDALVGGSRERIIWTLADAFREEGDKVVIQLLGRPHRSLPSGVVPEVVRAVTSGILTLQSSSTRPPHYTDEALEHAHRLSDLAAKLDYVGIRNGTVGTKLSQDLAAHIDELTGTAVKAIGSIEGTLQGINLHERKSFSVYDRLTGRRIQCEFGNRIKVPEVAAALDKRVRVYGEVFYRADGEPTKVRVTELVQIEEPTVKGSDVRGMLA